MRTPHKITPDYLKDTIVEIRLAFNVSRELIPGLVLEALSPIGFGYTPVSTSNPSGVNISLGPNQQVAVGIGGNGHGFFIKENVRVQFFDSQIFFNCLADKYIGWNAYSQEIIMVIEQLMKKQFVKFFNRVSIRYISEFKDIEILKNIKGEINIQSVGVKLDNAILRLTDEVGNMKTFITLTNKAKRISPQESQIIEASLVDINVFENFEPSTDTDFLKEKLNQTHSKQKDTFFGLISDHFLKTLNPEY